MWSLSNLRPDRLAARQADVSRKLYDAANAHVHLAKSASAAPKLVHALAGRLVLSSSGWGLLEVPNALVRGAFDALHEPGAELPLRDGQLNAHISVLRPEDIEQLGGPDKLTERGHFFRYTLGPVREVEPAGWGEMSRVWFIEVKSPELEKLRKSYGLTPLPKEGKHQFHITVAVRRKHVLKANDVSKAAAAVATLGPHADALRQLSAHPAVRNWFMDHGLYWNNPHTNAADNMAEFVRAGGHWDAMAGAAPADHQTYVNLIGGMANMMGMQSTGSRRQAIERAAGDVVRVSPYFMTFAPRLWDEMHGARGSAASLASSIYRANRGTPDPVSGRQGYDPETAAQLAQGVHESVHGPGADPNLAGVFSSRDLGQLYEQMVRTGHMGAPQPYSPPAVGQRLLAAAGPLGTLRGLTEQLHKQANEAAPGMPAAMSMLDDLVMLHLQRLKARRAAASARPGVLDRIDTTVGEPKAAAVHHARPVTVKRRDRSGEIWICPHCGGEIAEKTLYRDKKGWWFHRPCLAKGSICLPEKRAGLGDIIGRLFRRGPTPTTYTRPPLPSTIDMPPPTAPPVGPEQVMTKIRQKFPQLHRWLTTGEKIAAEGIPDREDQGDLSQVRSGDLLDWVVQRHAARRAGLHHDVRFGSPETGLYSWAVRKGLPGPGGKHLAVRQPLHDYGYKDFSGEIGEGYGAGRVDTAQKGQVLVTHVGPGEVHFTTGQSRYPERFILKQTGGKNWLLINTTKTESIPHEKVHYAKIPQEQAEHVLKNLRPGSSVQAKIDGAASLTKLYKDHFEVVSYRAAKGTGHPIVHTERVLHGRPRVDVPPSLRGLVLRGELYGTDPAGKAIRPQQLGGLLNSGVARSIRDQRERGVNLKQLLFDADPAPGESERPPYADRLARVREALGVLPASHFHGPEEATTPEAALALWRKIKGGHHPLTREGVVVHPPDGKPSKIKLTDEHDVHVREVFPGKGKYLNTGAGGFRYSFGPEGDVAGEVGTGLSDELRRSMHERPQDFIGRVARVRAQEQFPGGALRAPALIAMHEDLPLAKVGEAADGQLLAQCEQPPDPTEFELPAPPA